MTFTFIQISKYTQIIHIVFHTSWHYSSYTLFFFALDMALFISMGLSTLCPWHNKHDKITVLIKSRGGSINAGWYLFYKNVWNFLSGFWHFTHSKRIHCCFPFFIVIEGHGYSCFPENSDINSKWQVWDAQTSPCMFGKYKCNSSKVIMLPQFIYSANV